MPVDLSMNNKLRFHDLEECLSSIPGMFGLLDTPTNQLSWVELRFFLELLIHISLICLAILRERRHNRCNGMYSDA